MLIINKNVALSREQLYEAVWQEEYYGDTRTLDNHIKRLRQKLGYEDVIKTIFRIGYRMEVTEEETVEDIHEVIYWYDGDHHFISSDFRLSDGRIISETITES